MVDCSNDLTYRILHYHSILNRNNFAFSPTALMSVLVALYEGAEGRSAKEIQNVLLLPTNKDVVRVGYRDIHRRLRTYFFDSENPLRGLLMNRPNISITREYEKILMFYGYDLGVDMISSNKNNLTNAEVDNLSAKTTTTTSTTTTTTEIPSTTIPTTTTTTTTLSTTTTEEPTSTSTTTTTTTIAPETSTTEADSTTNAANTEETTTLAIESTTNEANTEKVENSEAEELVSEPFSRLQKARVVRLPNAKLQAPSANYLPQSARKLAAARLAARNKRHLWDSAGEVDANLLLTLFTPELVQHSLFDYSNVYFAADFDPTAKLQTHSQLQQEQQKYNTDIINHVFYLNNQQLVHTTFKVYNAVLYYKYYEQLRLNVLELELDTKQYNLMILLPDFHVDLVTAAAALRLGPTLREMRKQLKPRWVQAIIPDFHLDGSMFLTNDLQNLGICEIFEPNRADFRSMTEEAGVYVKHIEQSINVHIRTHPINQHKRNYGQQTQPIQLSVNHAFMFFIIDRDLDVAVMAGRVLNPLNVRIQ